MTLSDTNRSTRLLLLFLGILGLLAACCQAQNNCVIKVMHVLPSGGPIDVKVGDTMVATNVPFEGSALTAPNVTCGPQPVMIFPAGNETSIRQENFPINGGQNVINYVVFGGELRAPNDTNVFLLSVESVLLLPRVPGKLNIAFWHYSPTVRTQDVVMEVLNGGVTVANETAKFQQRADYQTIDMASGLGFRYSNTTGAVLLNTNRSLATIKDGSATAFLFGPTNTPPVMFLENDPSAPPQAGGGSTASSASGGSSNNSSMEASSSHGGNIGTGSSLIGMSSSSESESYSSTSGTPPASGAADSLRPLLSSLF